MKGKNIYKEKRYLVSVVARDVIDVIGEANVEPTRAKKAKVFIMMLKKVKMRSKSSKKNTTET